MSMIHINNPSTKSNLTATLDDKCIQPNAVDLPVKDVFKIDGGIVDLSNKVHAKRTKVEPTDGVYTLEGGKYDVVFATDVEIAEGEAGFLIQRSSLNRNGARISSGLYDSGYKNLVGGCLHVPDNITLKFNEGERLAQLLMFKAETVGMYTGSYNKSAPTDEVA